MTRITSRTPMTRKKIQPMKMRMAQMIQAMISVSWKLRDSLALVETNCDPSLFIRQMTRGPRIPTPGTIARMWERIPRVRSSLVGVERGYSSGILFGFSYGNIGNFYQMPEDGH